MHKTNPGVDFQNLADQHHPGIWGVRILWAQVRHTKTQHGDSSKPNIQEMARWTSHQRLVTAHVWLWDIHQGYRVVTHHDMIPWISSHQKIGGCLILPFQCFPWKTWSTIAPNNFHQEEGYNSVVGYWLHLAVTIVLFLFNSVHWWIMWAMVISLSSLVIVG